MPLWVGAGGHPVAVGWKDTNDEVLAATIEYVADVVTVGEIFDEEDVECCEDLVLDDDDVVVVGHTVSAAFTPTQTYTFAWRPVHCPTAGFQA